MANDCPAPVKLFRHRRRSSVCRWRKISAFTVGYRTEHTRAMVQDFTGCLDFPHLTGTCSTGCLGFPSLASTCSCGISSAGPVTASVPIIGPFNLSRKFALRRRS